MARPIPLKSDAGLTKVGYVGFSWTLLFFGFFVPLSRGDFVWFILYLILYCCGGCIVLPFMYNKIYTKGLIANGYKLSGTDAEIAMNKAALGII